MRGHILRRVFKRLSDARGTSLVEAAVATPLLLLLTFGIVDFAMMFYAYLALENGASQASRYAVTGNLAPGMSREESIRYAMRQATPTLTLGDENFSFSHIPAGGSSWVGGTGGPNDIAKLTINYTWEFYTPLVRPFFTNGRMNLKVESAMKNESRFE